MQVICRIIHISTCWLLTANMSFLICLELRNSPCTGTTNLQLFRFTHCGIGLTHICYELFLRQLADGTWCPTVSFIRCRDSSWHVQSPMHLLAPIVRTRPFVAGIAIGLAAMPAMTMQCIHMGTFTSAHSAVARRSRCFVKTLAVVAAPPKTTLKTENSEKVLPSGQSRRNSLPLSL